MSTRLSKNDADKSKENLLKLLDNGIKFIECPLTDEEKGIFWHRGFPDDLLDAYTVLNDHGVGVEYSATTRAVGMVVPAGGDDAYAIRLCMVDSQRGFFTITQKMMQNFPAIKLADDQYTRWPLMSQQEMQTRLGDKYQAFMDWARDAAIMDEEIANAQAVLEELFGMVKTAGQLRRMVPDLFRYLPSEQQEAFADQKRASSLPFEWAAYDKAKVDRMLITVNKCHLLNGLSKPSMAEASQSSDAFSWASKRKVAADEANAAKSA